MKPKIRLAYVLCCALACASITSLSSQAADQPKLFGKNTKLSPKLALTTKTLTTKQLNQRSIMRLGQLQGRQISLANRQLSTYGTIAKLNTRSSEGLSQARSALRVLSQNYKELSSGLSGRYQQAAIADEKFVAGARAFADRHGVKQAIDMLKRNPNQVNQIQGASSVSKRIDSMMRADAKRLNSASQAMRQLQSQRISAVDHSVIENIIAGLKTSVEDLPVRSMVLAVLGIQEAHAEPLTIIAGAAAAAAVVVIAAYGDALAEHYGKSYGPEDDQDQAPTTSSLQRCQARADRSFDQCITRAGGSFWKELACHTKGTADAAACLFIPK